MKDSAIDYLSSNKENEEGIQNFLFVSNDNNVMYNTLEKQKMEAAFR